MDDKPTQRLSASTLAAQALGVCEPTTRGVVPSIHVATTYLRDEDNSYRFGHVYGRADNRSVQHAQEVVAALDGADEALLFGSGMAAATAVFMALPPDSHVVAPQVMYWGLRSWLAALGNRGPKVTFVDASDSLALRREVRQGETRVIWIETPSNPLWTITDIEAAADIAHANRATLCVDATVATPILTRPLALGADIVMHSATKYLNGHSDVVAGSLATSQRGQLWSEIRRIRDTHGMVLSPFEAWLLTRGIRTLDVRVKAQSTSAARLALELSRHPAVSAVLYPGLPTHAGHDIAKRQMISGFGGMLSIRMKGGEAAAIAVAAHVKLWKRATSLGGVESLVEHRSSIEGPGSPCPPDLLRLSVGLEDTDDLLADLLYAFAALG